VAGGWLAALVGMLVSAATTLWAVRWWIPVARERGLVGRDMNKYEEVYVAEAGGIAPLLGYVFSLFVLLFGGFPPVEVLSVASVLLLVGFMAFVDDVTGWKRGLPQWLKPLLTLVASLPVVAVVAQHPSYNPFPVPLWLYSFVLVPIGVMGASNAFNMLAGYNGLEAGLSIILLFFLGLKAFATGHYWVAVASLMSIFPLLVFFYFNKYPARVFPGDTLPYAFGALYAVLSIFSNLEVFAVAMMPLFFLELILKLRKGFEVENFGKPLPDGSIELPYKNLYSVCHIAINLLKKIFGRATEQDVVCFILIFQFVVSVFTFFVS